MLKRVLHRLSVPALTALMFLPTAAWAGGDKAMQLVVVADTRRISWGILRYFADLYNTNPLLFAIWAVVMTAACGGILGLLMDLVISRTGLDLRSRKILEH